MLKAPPAIAATALILLSPSAQAILLFDDFNQTGNNGAGATLSLTAISGSFDDQFQSAPVAGSISNDRDALLDQIFGVDGIAVVDQINPNTPNGYISFSALQFFSEADLELVYAGLGGIDLTEGGANHAFQLFVRSQSNFGFGEVTWAVGVEDTLGEFDITDDTIIAEGFNTIAFPADTSVDYTSVEDIVLYVNAFSIASIESVQFDDFRAVPEPGTYAAIIGLGILAFVAVRRPPAKRMRRGTRTRHP